MESSIAGETYSDTKRYTKYLLAKSYSVSIGSGSQSVLFLNGWPNDVVLPLLKLGEHLPLGCICKAHGADA